MTKHEDSQTEGAKSTIRISNTIIGGLGYLLQAMGFKPEQIFAQTNVTPDNLRDTDGAVDEPTYDRIFQNGVELTGNAHLGLHLGSQLTLQQLGVLGYLLMNSDSFMQALKAYENFQSAIGDSIVLKTSIQGSKARIAFQIYGGELTGRHRLESFFSSLPAACKELTGRELQYTRIGSVYGAANPEAEYKKFFKIIPEKSSENYVEFNAEYLNLLIINSVPELTPVFEGQLQEKLNRLDNSSFSKKLKREISRRIGQEKMESLESMSSFFNMSDRALQMKLEQENTSFREIHESCQSEFAIRFLKSGSSTAEIAYALGFSEPSAFQRAFKRWTGQTPGQFRQS